MRSSNYEISTAVVTDTELMIFLKDGRRITMPLWWSIRLWNATDEQRQNWSIMPFGDALMWKELDEHISVQGILSGGPFPGAVCPSYIAHKQQKDEMEHL